MWFFFIIRLLFFQFATSLKGEHGQGFVVVIEDGQEQGLPDDEKELFSTYLPLHKKHVIPASNAPKDEVVVKKPNSLLYWQIQYMIYIRDVVWFIKI